MNKYKLNKRTKDLTGKIFEKLRVLKFAGYKLQRNGSKIAQWLCICKCKNKVIVLASQLKRKQTTSCGCLRKDYTKVKLPYGHIAIKYLYSKKGRSIWLFKCHCGKEFESEAANVSSGRVKSCGCLNHKNYTKVVLPNKIVAIKYLYSNKYGKAVWLFKCRCGKEFICTGSDIATGSTKSCGCLPNTTAGFYSKEYNCSFDSLWEFNFVKILEYLETKWQREPKTFKLSNGKKYTPDFYLPEFNMFIEIKGRWYKDKNGFSLGKEKTRLFKKEYPKYNYYIIDKKKYSELEKKFGFLLT